MFSSDETPTLYDCIELYGMDFDAAMADYPIWDETRRAYLNECIKRHFLYRQIAQDTPAKHAYYLNRTMHDMMGSLNPYFKVIDSTDIDILSTADAQATQTARTKQVNSALPQSRLDPSKDYATSSAENDSSSTSTSSGRSVPIADMLTKWASSVTNGLFIVYNGLEPLYMQIFPNDDWEVDY